MFFDLLSRYNTTIDPRILLINLLVAVILGYGVSFLYLVTVGQTDKKLARLFPVMAAATTLACTLIASSLGIAIGLVGAMSFVRFRKVTPYIEQSVFLFLAISVGLASGTGHTLSGFVTLLVITPILIIRYRYDRQRATTVELAVHGEPHQVELALTNLSGRVPGIRLSSMEQSGAYAKYRFTFPIREWSQVLNIQRHLSGIPHLNFSFSERNEVEA